MLLYKTSRDRPRTIDARVRAMAERWPDRTALEVGRDRSTYRRLLANGRAVAGTLQALPKWHRDPVVVVLGVEGPARIEAMLGGWLGGLAVAPLAPDMPPAVLGEAIGALSPQALCVDQASIPVLPELLPLLPSGLPIVVPDGDALRALGPVGDRNPVRVLDSRGAARHKPAGWSIGEVAAHLWVTRGDGGRWVARTHGDLLEDVDRHAARYRVRAAARVSHLHDLDGHRGIVDLLLPWSVGGTACSPGPDGDLVAWLRDARVSLLRLTPSQLRALDAAGALDAAVLRTVLAVVLEGEGHRGRDVAHLREAAPEALIESVFGRTEAGSSLLVHRVQPGPVAPPGAPTPLGLPFDGVRLAIVDGAGFPVQPGTPGQLAVASSRGQVVRTGDRVKAVKGLGVRHLGRADDMVQLRGRRISLDAVGAVISELAGAPAVVVGWPMAAPGSAQGLVGFVQAESVDAAPVLAAARERLAGGLVPAGLLAVPGLPRLADGRPDRVRLMKYLASRARG